MRQGLLTPAKVAINAKLPRLPRRKPVAKLAVLLRELELSRADR